MALPRYAVHASSLVALMGLLSLLLADSAPDSCEETLFDRTFDVSTTCKGDHVARVRIKREVSSSIEGTGTASAGFARGDAQVLSGDIDVQGGSVLGVCSSEDEPFAPSGITLTIAAAPLDPASGVGVERADCTVNFDSDLGKDVPCTSPDFPIADCTLRLTEVP
jgi:hypothetical protein